MAVVGSDRTNLNPACGNHNPTIHVAKDHNLAIQPQTEDNTIALGLHLQYIRIVLTMKRRDFVTLKLFAAVLM